MWWDTFNYWSVTAFLWTWPVFALYFVAKEVKGWLKK